MAATLHRQPSWIPQAMSVTIAAVTLPTITEKPASSPQRHILLIEDSEPDATLTEMVHKDLKYCSSLQTVHDGDAALADLKSGALRPDLIFLDLSLPKRSGLDVIAELKRVPGCELIPIVVLTASPNPDDVREAYRRGASSVIKKSHDLDEYYRVLHCCYQYWCTVVFLPTP